MRWLLLKDLQILRRSPLLVSLLVVYPIAIALLIGFALSRGPDKPRVAIVNQVPAGQGSFDIAGERVNGAQYARRLYDAVDPVRVHTRAQALAKVRAGDALAALIIPADITQKLSTGIERPTVEVAYNVEDPVKASFVQSTIKARLADANAALSGRFTEVAAGYIRLLLDGGRFSILGRDLDILGLKRARSELAAARASLPRGSPRAAALTRVISFASLAIENLDVSGQVLRSVSSPIEVRETVLQGRRTPLGAFAVAVAVTVSLMFVTVLLASGLLALEREENAFGRLVRGLVSRVGLVAEKIGLSAGCALAVTLALLAGIALFVGLDWSRFPLWVVALALGALAFAALGVAIGALAREVRAASLLAFLVSLPIAFLALVPSGAVSGGLYGVIRVVSALLPFKPALQAVNGALNSGTGIAVPALHLVALTLAFAAIGRLALRRFA